MGENKELTLMADLILHVMYEYQHLAGRKGISEEMTKHYVLEALAEFGDMPSAINGIRERCGLPSRS